MVHSPRGGDGDPPVDPAMLNILRLRQEVERQEQRVRLMEQRKQQRDELLSRLRATLSRTQPQGLREIATAAEQILEGLTPDAEGDSGGTATEPALSPEVEAQLAVATTTDDTVKAETVDEFLQQEEAGERRGRRRGKRKHRERRGGKAATVSGRPAHADPTAVAAPKGFDTTKARAINRRREEEEEANRARLYALLDTLTGTDGPLKAAPASSSAEPAWLREDSEAAEDVSVACCSRQEDVNAYDDESSRNGARVALRVTLPEPHHGEEEEYADDFEDDDDDAVSDKG